MSSRTLFYEKLHVTPSGFEKVSTMIMEEVAKNCNDIEKSELGYQDVTTSFMIIIEG